MSNSDTRVSTPTTTATHNACASPSETKRSTYTPTKGCNTSATCLQPTPTAVMLPEIFNETDIVSVDTFDHDTMHVDMFDSQGMEVIFPARLDWDMDTRIF
jgi:hypothetical protein